MRSYQLMHPKGQSWQCKNLKVSPGNAIIPGLLQSGGFWLLSTDVVRQDLASEVENHQSRYIGFFHDEKALQAWIESMKKDGEWCDGRIAVRAAAHLFGVPFVVFRKCNPDQPPSCFLPEYIGPGNDMDLDPLCLVLEEPGADEGNY